MSYQRPEEFPEWIKPLVLKLDEEQQAKLLLLITGTAWGRFLRGRMVSALERMKEQGKSEEQLLQWLRQFVDEDWTAPGE